nr:antirestriction protein ArdA [Pseudomonas sp. ABC1]
MSEEIRICVADLAAYNAGHLHGVWIDAMQELDDIQAQVDAMLAASPVGGMEEYAIHDFEGFDCRGRAYLLSMKRVSEGETSAKLIALWCRLPSFASTVSQS